MPRPFALLAYLAFSARAEGWARRKLKKRLAEGKEDPIRLPERRGIASLPRPKGRLIWFHAASVGESLSLLELFRRLSLDDPDLQFLLTTGTVSSAQILEARLPDQCRHQYVPLDCRKFVRSFYDHWQPDLAIWTESELWPSLLCEAHSRKIPMLLINARMSEQSARAWRWLRHTARELMQLFTAVQAQDETTAAVLAQLGVAKDRLEVVGTLKEGTPALPCDAAELQELSSHISGRPVWCAASTHQGEEAQVLEAHRAVLRNFHRSLLILVPRHPDRGAELLKTLRSDGWKVCTRSEHRRPDSDCQIFLADSLGEMGLWYRLAPISFVGGSLMPIGGHNPFEPAALGSAVITGPHTANFRDIFTRLDAAGASVTVESGAGLGETVIDLMKPDRRAPMALAAWEVASRGADVTDRVMRLIQDHLPKSTDDPDNASHPTPQRAQA